MEPSGETTRREKGRFSQVNKMKRARRSEAGCLVVVVFLGLGHVLAAQTNSSQDTVAGRQGEVIHGPVPGEAPVELPSVTRQELWDQDRVPQTVRDRLRAFQLKREEYLKQQSELARKLRGATDTDREHIREMIKEQRQVWLEEARKIREQARERLEELKDELPRHKELLDAARDKARERAREAVEQARERRGTD
jgi:hypothetical protein